MRHAVYPRLDITFTVCFNVDMCYQCEDYVYQRPCPQKFPGCAGECEGFDCMDCGSNTLHLNEYYMVHKELWLTANPQDRGMLCIGCLETRLGRKLGSSDFTDAPVNAPLFFTQSLRLRSRIRSRKLLTND